MLGFESLLERDYMLLLEFDDAVEKFEEQPVKIPFKTGIKPYVPDILVHYRSSGKPDRKPLLTEVKDSADLKKNAAKYAPKFKQAKIFAEEHGWDFHVVTETDIRIPRLKNLKFLREYLNVEPEPSLFRRVMDIVVEEGAEIGLNTLLDKQCRNDNERLVLIPVVWCLVATGHLVIDFDRPIDDKTVLSLPKRRAR